MRDLKNSVVHLADATEDTFTCKKKKKSDFKTTKHLYEVIYTVVRRISYCYTIMKLWESWAWRCKVV